MRINNLSDQIDEIRIADDCNFYTSYRVDDLIIDGNSIRLKHLLETEIESLYIDEIQESLYDLSISAILNIEIIITEDQEDSSIISSFIEDVSINRIDVISCSDRELLDLHRDVITDEIESEILTRFNRFAIDAKIIRKENQ